MNTIAVFLIILAVALVICYIWAEHKFNEEINSIKHVDYVYYSECMLVDAIFKHNIDCIKNGRSDSLLEYKEELPRLEEACEIKNFTWKKLISKEKIERLKPYLPENPDEYIRYKMKEGKTNGYFNGSN